MSIHDLKAITVPRPNIMGVDRKECLGERNVKAVYKGYY